MVEFVHDVLNDDQLEAAQRLKHALDLGVGSASLERTMAVKEARVRLNHHDFDRVIALLEPRLDQYEEEYVTSIRTEDRDSKGDEFNERSS